jgi:hypothetical protein
MAGWEKEWNEFKILASDALESGSRLRKRMGNVIAHSEQNKAAKLKSDTSDVTKLGGKFDQYNAIAASLIDRLGNLKG